MNDFPSEYAKPKRHIKPIVGVIWLWIVTLGVCGLGLFFPNYLTSSSHHNHSRSNCMSNHKQIMTSLANYASDFDDYFPPYFSFDGTEKQKEFMTANRPYLKNDSTYVCPAEQFNIYEKKPSPPSTEGSPGKLEYVHCLSLMGVIPGFSDGKRRLHYSTVPDTAKTPFLRDVIRGYTVKDTPSFTSSHGNTFAVSYIDGHVRSVKLKSPTDL